MINPPLLRVSALFFLALVTLMYLGSWLFSSAVLRAGRRRLSHRAAKRILLRALAAPPAIAAAVTLKGAFLRHSHAAPLLEHHSSVCRQMAERLSTLSDVIGTGTGTRIAGLLGNGFAWILLAAGLFLFARLVRDTRRLEREITPFLAQPSARLARALERLSPQLPGGTSARFYECAIPMACSSLLGLFRPRCMLSKELVAGATDDELIAVVAHEAAHLRMGDAAAAFFVGLFNCAFFFLLPVRWMTRRWREEAELAGDAAAAACTGKPLALAGAILRASGVQAAQDSTGPPRPVSALAFTDEAACSLEKRVEMLIAQARGSAVPAIESTAQAVGSWLVTLGLAGVALLLFSSASAVCYAHCSLEAVARLMP